MQRNEQCNGTLSRRNKTEILFCLGRTQPAAVCKYLLREKIKTRSNNPVLRRATWDCNCIRNCAIHPRCLFAPLRLDINSRAFAFFLPVGRLWRLEKLLCFEFYYRKYIYFFFITCHRLKNKCGQCYLEVFMMYSINSEKFAVEQYSKFWED